MSNQATAYDVGIVPAVVESGRPYWRAVDVRHLTPAENRGKHHVFVDIVDEAGRPVRDPKLRIGWTWDGRQPSEPAPPQPLDKSPSEPAGNVELASTRQVTTVWRAAIDACLRDPEGYRPLDEWQQVLGRVSEGQQTTLGAYARPWQ